MSYCVIVCCGMLFREVSRCVTVCYVVPWCVVLLWDVVVLFVAVLFIVRVVTVSCIAMIYNISVM